MNSLLERRLLIHLFGDLRVSRGEDASVDVGGQKVGALLAFLALNLGRGATRDDVLARLWPEDDEEEARHRLRQTLYALRKRLEEAPLQSSDALVVHRTTLSLDPEVVDTDVARFERLVAQAAREADASARSALLAKAVTTYAGGLLPGYYQDCFVAEGNRLAGLHRSALHELIAAWELAGDVDLAIDQARRVIASDPLSEEMHCALMRLYAAKGQPSAVRRQYQELEKVLKETLGEEPSPTARALMESLRQTDFRPAPLPPPPVEPERPAAPAAPERSRRTHRPVGWVVGVALAAVAVLSVLAAKRDAARPSAAVSRLLWNREVVADEFEFDSEATDLRVDPQGDVTIVGFTNTKTHDKDFLVARYDPAGKLRWKRTYNGPGNDVDRAQSMAMSDHGEYVWVCGDSDNGKGNGGTRLCGLDYAVVKYDANGKKQWARRFNGVADGEDRAVKVGVDNFGNCYVTGFSAGGTDIKHPTFSTVTVKYGPDGDEIWRAQLDRVPGAPYETRPTDMLVTVGGHTIVTGYARLPGRGPNAVATFLAYYRPDGSLRWVRWFGETEQGDDSPRRLAASGGFYVASKGYQSPKPGWPPCADMLLTKFDEDGNLRWARSWSGGAGLDSCPKAVAVHSTGCVCVVGETLTSPDNLDLVTLMYSPHGDERWVRRYAGKAGKHDTAQAVDFDGAGNVYVGGFSTERLQMMDPKYGRDYVLLKYSAAGEPVWREVLDSAVQSIDAIAMLGTDPASKTVIVTGQMAGGVHPAIHTVKYAME